MIQLHNKDCIELMATMPDISLDIICIDPPYLYLKNQKLERPFDEQLFFSECKRLLTKDGFIVMFGRGESFYRWNTRLADLGMNFKEEIVWDKSYTSSPLMCIGRVHETVSVWSKGKGAINRVKVPYLEMKGHDIGSIIQDIKRLKGVLKNERSLSACLEYIENNVLYRETEKHYSITYSGGSTIDRDRSAAVLSAMDNGLNEKTIIRTDKTPRVSGKGAPVREGMYNTDRAVNVVHAMEMGLTEKTVIKEIRDHYSAIHPTQKPVRLLERLLALVLPKKKERKDVVVADFFGGSFSTMEACHNMGLQGIASEIYEEYFNLGKQRIENLKEIPPKQQVLF